MNILDNVVEKYLIVLACPFCGKEHSVKVPAEGYIKWLNGELVQKAFPELSATEREQLISQICPDCQESIFG